MPAATFFSIIFFLMIIMLGLDSTVSLLITHFSEKSYMFFVSMSPYTWLCFHPVSSSDSLYSLIPRNQKFIFALLYRQMLCSAWLVFACCSIKVSGIICPSYFILDKSQRKQCDRTFISVLCCDLVSISLCLSALRQPAGETRKALIMYR